MAQQQPAKEISTDSAGSPAANTKPTTTQGPANALAATPDLKSEPAKPVPAWRKRPFNPPYIGGHPAGSITTYDSDGKPVTKNLDPLFAYPLDTANGVHDAVAYLSDDTNRARYTYDDLQLLIGRVMRAAQDFGIHVEGISNRIKS